MQNQYHTLNRNLPIISFLIAIHLVIGTNNSYSASFDCQMAKTFIETSICSNKMLSDLDDQLAIAYKRALDQSSNQNELRKNQREWLKTTRNVCQSEDCLKKVYEQRILMTFLYNEKQTPSPEKEHCDFPEIKLPDEYMLFAGGGYLGRKLNFRIDSSGVNATQVDVVVNYTSKPVVLMLGNYNPTIWNISWTKGTRIIGVLASGYYRQAIAGLEPEIPTLIATFDNKSACGFFYVTDEALKKIDPMARRIFGRPIDTLYRAQEAKIEIGEPLPADVQPVTSPVTPPESFFDKCVPLVGIAALEDAVHKGLLRKVTFRDAEDWENAVEKSKSPESLTITKKDVSKNPLLVNSNRAFVVLQPFTFPEGLSGDPSLFLIPKGVKIPDGDPGFSAIFDLNSLHCFGVLCSAFNRSH